MRSNWKWIFLGNQRRARLPEVISKQMLSWDGTENSKLTPNTLSSREAGQFLFSFPCEFAEVKNSFYVSFGILLCVRYGREMCFRFGHHSSPSQRIMGLIENKVPAYLNTHLGYIHPFNCFNQSSFEGVGEFKFNLLYFLYVANFKNKPMPER